MLEKVKQFVNESFEKSDFPNMPDHLQRTVEWVLKLKPDADETIKIAAMAHDIARAFASAEFEAKPFNDLEYLEQHQENGAKIIADFLRERKYNEKEIDRVYDMVKFHEVGGNGEADLIKDADSLSYLEKPAHLKPEHIKSLGKENVKVKIDLMYNRISSDKAKELARPYYDQAMKTLAAIT